MASNLTRFTAASMIVKSCHQQPIGNSRSRRRNYENNTSARSRFRIHCSGGGGDGDDANVSEKGKHEEVGRCRGTQTDYRESETQTSPWEPPYKLKLRANGNPEILNLKDFTWGHGLPAGMHEIQIIKRMRMKKAWMELLPPMDTPANVKTCQTIIAAIEANEWAFREAEMQLVMDARMKLMERLEENNSQAREEKFCQRMKRLANRLCQQRDKQIHDIRRNFSREVRKLNRQYRSSSASAYKIHRSNIIARFANPTSHLYAPEMRFGFNAHGRHEILDKTQLSETYVDREIRSGDTTNWLPTNEELLKIRSITRPEELCPRRTRWTDEKLRALHADLKAIRLNETANKKSDKPTLLKRKLKLPALPVTPLKKKSANGDNYWENSSLFLQKITRGRAVQCMMYEGRDRCRELIEELRSTHSLKDADETFNRNVDPDLLVRSREQKDKLKQDHNVCEILDSLEGMTVAGMLDMLCKEEQRLREERKAHALVMLLERERNRREAEEAGRRQLERNRRRELDEMFRQMVKINQDTVQTYLEDIINEGIEWAAEKNARQYVEELADEIEASTLEFNRESDPNKDTEMVVDMVQHFLLPEVDKQIMRKKIRDRQQEYLSEAHRMIYNEIMKTKSVETVEKTDSLNRVSDEKCYEDEIDVEGNESTREEDRTENISG